MLYRGEDDCDWFCYYDKHGTYPKTQVLDIGLAQEMQVAHYIGLWDNTCALTTSFQQIKDLGPYTSAHVTVYPFAGHVSWIYFAQPWFVNDLAE